MSQLPFTDGRATVRALVRPFARPRHLFVCQGLWFDDLELLQLTPGATLQLFAALGQTRENIRHPLSDRLVCPRCTSRLIEAHDLQRATRFSFFRCPAGHGRYLTFFQFLRAKNFVRSLDVAEIAELRSRVRQVNCANCGAPVDIERGTACTFCRSPIAMLDPDQVRKTLAELDRAEQKRQAIDPTLPVQLLTERLRAERAFATPAEVMAIFSVLDGERTPSLVEVGLRAVARWLSKTHERA
jgi:DNA-directed RNA polymerase subunit RPC12/RpoP